MKNLVSFFIALLFFISQDVQSESYAKRLGAYRADVNGVCRDIDNNIVDNDYVVSGVCFPAENLFRGDFVEFHMYAVIELNEPEKLEAYAVSRAKNSEWLKKHNAQKSFEAYNVYVDSYKEGILTLKDGTKGYVLLYEPVHFNQALLLRDKSQWYICFNRKAHKYSISQHNPYMRSSNDVKSIEEAENEC
ncbi:MAG: hypothetical protein CL587_02145 [Alteromonadaceae bacterium]|nr:hypothetical protein [Alteromonadaceae bacterium]